jgi:hypothetical protein
MLEPEGVDLLRQMLAYDPAQRISVSVGSRVRLLGLEWV